MKMKYTEPEKKFPATHTNKNTEWTEQRKDIKRSCKGGEKGKKPITYKDMPIKIARLFYGDSVSQESMNGCSKSSKIQQMTA